MSTAATATWLMLALLVRAEQLHAQGDWNLELAPYLWTVGTDADVTLDSQTARIKREFDNVDLGGSILGAGRIDRFVIWSLLDFLALDTDELDRVPSRGRLQTDLSLATLGFGYQFGGRGGNSLDVLLGVRRLSLDSKLMLNGVGRFTQDEDFTDAVVIVRPGWSLAERWLFDPTIALGGGDSELTWELQPQFQYRLTDSIAIRFGYRYVYYRLDSDDRVSHWDGAIDGLIFGIGGLFRL